MCLLERPEPKDERRAQMPTERSPAVATGSVRAAGGGVLGVAMRSGLPGQSVDLARVRGCGEPVSATCSRPAETSQQSISFRFFSSELRDQLGDDWYLAAGLFPGDRRAWGWARFC